LDDLFDGELFYRLSLNYLRLPPLRDQPAEIERLAREILTQLRAEPLTEKSAPSTSASPTPPELFSPAALRALTRYPWPRNIRELNFAMHYAALRSTAEVDVAHLPPWIVNASARTEAWQPA
jgi:DNA-binding NtrC family response regulator